MLKKAMLTVCMLSLLIPMIYMSPRCFTSTASELVSAWVSRDFMKVYAMSDIESNEFLTAKDFDSFMQERIDYANQKPNILHTLARQDSQSKLKGYDVYYTVSGNSKPQVMTVWFNSDGLALSPIDVVPSLTLDLPKGSVAQLNGLTIRDGYIVESDSDFSRYLLTSLLPKEYTLTVKSPYLEEYRTVLNLSDTKSFKLDMAIPLPETIAALIEPSALAISQYLNGIYNAMPFVDLGKGFGDSTVYSQLVEQFSQTSQCNISVTSVRPDSEAHIAPTGSLSVPLYFEYTRSDTNSSHVGTATVSFSWDEQEQKLTFKSLEAMSL